MGNQKQRGFTIIELILFLGITGAMFAALMIGVNTSIAQQRYKESVTSYRALLEQQYAEVSHPRNDRDNKWTCSDDGGVQQAPNGGDARGTSNCVLLGRYIEIKANGTAVETGDVIGVQPLGNVTLTDDIAALIAYTPRLSPITPETRDVEWDSTLQTTAQRPSSASYLILRSPLSGLVRTFVRPEALPTNLVDALTPANSLATIKNCVVPGGAVGQPTQSVSVSAAVASANGIVVNGIDEEC
jgi:type II secretory pathway pseudopilin PulG